MRRRLYAAAFATLAIGLAVALGIYLGAGEDASSSALDAIYGSKPYVRELQRFGGRASVVFDEFMRWFGGLWEGRRLAYTVGGLSVLASFVLFLIARHLRERE